MLALISTIDLGCNAFSRSSNSLTLRQTSPLGATPEDTQHHVEFTSAEGALRSPDLARSLRKKRAARGRTKIPARTVEKRRRKSTAMAVQMRTHGKTPMKISVGRANGLDLPYESAIKALRAYHSIHSHLVFPRRFIVPHDSDYPSEWHGVDLSRTVYNMQWWQRHVKQNPDRVAELNKLGFIWERLLPQWNLVLEALITYSSLNGDLLVPTKFVVPHGSEHYPKSTWGLPLGKYVFRIRMRDDFLRGDNAGSRRKQLDGLGFVWDLQEHLFQKFYFALRHFKRLEEQRSEEGTGGVRVLRVPSTFVVPSGDDWPQQLWGYRLGEKCTAVRQKQLYVKNDSERQRALAELGFQWTGNATLGWLEVVHAAAIYSKMHSRNLDVPTTFVVPAPPHIDHATSSVDDDSTITGSDDAWPWPERLWGLNLGQRLKDIRLKGAYLKGSSASARRAQLDALGFNWTPKRGRPKKANSSGGTR